VFEDIVGEFLMRREKRWQERREKFLAQQDQKRERRQRKNTDPSSGLPALGDGHSGGRGGEPATPVFSLEAKGTQNG
jgi:hypothetical protein